VTAVEKLAAEITTQVETALSKEKELAEQIARTKERLVNLGSLFIDEGFGALDPDTLALVAETLQSLRVGGEWSASSPISRSYGTSSPSR
jgi:hypothetical protein